MCSEFLRLTTLFDETVNTTSVFYGTLIPKTWVSARRKTWSSSIWATIGSVSVPCGGIFGNVRLVESYHVNGNGLDLAWFSTSFDPISCSIYPRYRKAATNSIVCLPTRRLHVRNISNSNHNIDRIGSLVSSWASFQVACSSRCDAVSSLACKPRAEG